VTASVPPVIYQHPLAYLLGIEGIALLRGFAGDYDREFVQARLAEVRRLLDDETLAGHPGVAVRRGDTQTGYRNWAATYDEPRNSLFDHDEPIVHEILDALPAGDALDAACGTGRYARYLAARGHRVTGVDSSPEMLDKARAQLPDAEFRLGDLHSLPVEDRAVDLVVCALALAHVPALGPVMAEFARVLRPGGHLVIADAHHELVLRGSVPHAAGPDGEPGLAPAHRHTPGDYLRAALPVGLQVLRCEEPGHDEWQRPAPRPADAGFEPGGWQDWPWTLIELVPEANWAARAPVTVIWQFRRTSEATA
jgi:ubiquinone/menaquinone biosynthesis C-methylase UbiE